MLEHVNKVLKRPPLTREDVEGVYAGLRPPLLAGDNDSTAKLSREHVVAHPPVPGLVVVAGGKYTTYRVMAKDAVDEATRAMDERVPSSCTETIPLLGAEGFKAAWNRRGRSAEQAGVHVARVEHLLNRFGSMTPPKSWTLSLDGRNWVSPPFLERMTTWLPKLSMQQPTRRAPR